MFHPGTDWHDLLRPTEATVGIDLQGGGQSDLGQKCPSLWHPTNAQLWIKTRSIWPRSPWDWDPGSRMEGQGAKSHGDSIQRLQQFIDSKVLPKSFYSASQFLALRNPTCSLMLHLKIPPQFTIPSGSVFIWCEGPYNTMKHLVTIDLERADAKMYLIIYNNIYTYIYMYT